MIDIPLPAPGECAPYYHNYTNAAAHELARTGRTIQDLLASQPGELSALLATADETLSSHAYAPGKWTLSESLVHVSDTERVFAYRLLRIARGDTIALPGFDQDAWVPESRSRARPLQTVLAEFNVVRASTIALIDSLDEIALTRSGTASNQPVSARALVWIIAGHAAHHIRITAERYLAAPAAH